MKVTKLEHACLIVTEGHDTLVVDPGGYTTPVSDLTGVVAVVITHEHADHWTPEQLERIRESSPEVRFIGPAGVAAAATGFPVEIVGAGDRVDVGEFRLDFFGGKHAVIHRSIPVVDNVGVLVNRTLYYGGDNFTVPGVPVDTLAVPAGAPWLKISEVMDYVAELGPKRAFPTHDMGLSVIGKNLTNTRLETVTKEFGGEYFVLEPGSSLDI
jgi:L-ascorbate metabolism protein UlaG (beta-lactamase superfamily)